MRHGPRRRDPAFLLLQEVLRGWRKQLQPLHRLQGRQLHLMRTGTVLASGRRRFAPVAPVIALNIARNSYVLLGSWLGAVALITYWHGWTLSSSGALAAITAGWLSSWSP